MWLLPILIAAVIGWAATAQAAPIAVTITATVTADPTVAQMVGVGTVMTVNLILDDATPDLDGSPSVYSGVNVGTLTSFLIVAVTGTVDTVTTDTVAGTWSNTGVLNVLGFIFLPFTTTVSGVGLTPNQPIPNFWDTPAPTGTIVVDLTAIGGLAALIPGDPNLYASITSISSVVPAVPEPGLGLLLVLAGLVVRRRTA